MQKGLIYFKDLYKFNTNQFRDRQSLETHFGINITAFDFMCLIQSIPGEIQKYIKEMATQNDNSEKGYLVSEITSKTKTCSFTYQNILRQLTYQVKGRSKWEQILAKNIEEIDWHRIFTLSHSLTPDSQLKIFQYKIIHRILPSNGLLHIYKLRNNPWCDRCPTTIENLEHLFHLCPTVLHIWHGISQWLAPQLNLFKNINTENIILGDYKKWKS